MATRIARITIRAIYSVFIYSPIGLDLTLPKRETINPVTTTTSTATIKFQLATLIPHRHAKSVSLLVHHVPIKTFPYTNISNSFFNLRAIVIIIVI